MRAEGAATRLACTPGDGLGNTMLVVTDQDAARSGLPAAELARRACGGEFDGLLLIGEPAGGVRPAGIHNRDGSDGGVCLNGLRVAALWTKKAAGAFLMAGRRVGWKLVPGGVELHLPPPQSREELRLAPVELGGRRGVAVPFWNPHCVVAVDDLEHLDLEGLAAHARKQRALFPDGVNLEAVADAGPGRLAMRVWERGVGETRACGSGAVAVALAAWAGGVSGALEVRMPGGSLVLAPAPDGGVLLTGPARLGPACERALA